MLSEQEHRRLRAQLGSKLRMLRRSRHLTQEQIGRRVGKSRSFVSKVEHGTRVLSFDELNDLAAVFALSASELLEGVVMRKQQGSVRRGARANARVRRDNASPTDTDAHALL